MRSITRLPSPPRPGRAVAAAVLAGAALAIAGGTSASAATSGPVTTQAATVAHHPATHHGTTQPLNSDQVAALRAAAHRHKAARHAKAARHVTEARHVTAPRHVTKARLTAHQDLTTWSAITHAVAGKAKGALPASDRLLPAAVSGPQSYMDMNSAQYANATTIVRQALAKHMGLRSAVIAVATAMQESQLINISYGTYDSLGLFQQQPDCGWGTAAQVTDPAYASDAFLSALRQYQGNNPDWATQPLWQAAQGVQKSGYPTAYAKWEIQAAHIVASIARSMY